MAFLNTLIILGIILVSVVLHELAHGLVAYSLGDETAKMEGRLSLNPLKHLDPFMSVLLPLMLYLMGAPVIGGAKPVPVDSRNFKNREWGMALVSLAGPITNLLIAFIVFLIGHFTEAIYYQGMAGDILLQAIVINLGFMTFNLIPIPPLDGSRLIYALAPDGVRKIMLGMEKYGIIIIYCLIFLLGGVFSEVIRAVIAGVFSSFYWIIGA